MNDDKDVYFDIEIWLSLKRELNMDRTFILSKIEKMKSGSKIPKVWLKQLIKIEYQLDKIRTYEMLQKLL